VLPLEPPDRIHVAFDDHHLAANAGLILPVTLPHHLGPGDLVDRHVDLGDAIGRAYVADKVMTLVAADARPNGELRACVHILKRWKKIPIQPN
jgi:hypothetical protein